MYGQYFHCPSTNHGSVHMLSSTNTAVKSFLFTELPAGLNSQHVFVEASTHVEMNGNDKNLTFFQINDVFIWISQK